MARFKRRIKRAYARMSSPRYARKQRRRSSSGSSGNPLMNVVLPSFVWGAVRPKAKEIASPVTNMLPLGDNSDEVAFGLLGYFMHKKGTGFVKNMGTAILTVEAASLGNNIVSPMISNVGSSSSTGAKNNAYEY